MQVNRISQIGKDASSYIGKKLLSKKPDEQKIKKGLNAINNFVQGEGHNPGRCAYYTLISAFVLAPRLMEAREPDEFREILTRDVITILTILFAMKGLKSGMCMAAQKKGGIPLVKDLVGKNAGKLKRLKGYLNPEGGIIAYGTDEIAARYSRMYDKESLVNAMELVDKEGGSIAKMFSIEKKKGVLTKIKETIFNKPEKAETPLYNAGKKIFGEGFENKSNQELLDILKNVTQDQKEAYEGLVDVVGTSKLNIVSEAGEAIDKVGILNSDANPLTRYAKNISANFETLSLALTAGFLGFGLPRFNEVFTRNKHLNKPASPSNKRPVPAKNTQSIGQIHNLIAKNKKMSAFQSFTGQN